MNNNNKKVPVNTDDIRAIEEYKLLGDDEVSNIVNAVKQIAIIFYEYDSSLRNSGLPIPSIPFQEFKQAA